jgi:hypothetical protein
VPSSTRRSSGPGPRSGWGSVGWSGSGSVPARIGASIVASTLTSPPPPPNPAGPATSPVAPIAARIRSGDAGRSWIQTPVASWIAATTAGAPTSIGSSPTPFAP